MIATRLPGLVGEFKHYVYHSPLGILRFAILGLFWTEITQ